MSILGQQLSHMCVWDMSIELPVNEAIGFGKVCFDFGKVE